MLHNDYDTLISVQKIQQTAVLQHFFKKNKNTFENLRANNFPVPTSKRENKDSNLSRTASTAASSDCSIQQESVKEQKDICIENEQFIHYSNILPAHDKKTEAINTLIGHFHSALLENDCAIGELQLFRSNIYKVLNYMALHWSEVKFQQADSMAVTVLLLVCMMSSISQKFMLKTIKSSNMSSFSRISSIKKTKAFILMQKIVNNK